MNNKKILILNTQQLISICDENIKEEKIKIKIYKSIINKVYISCKHDFEEVPSMGANIVKCKICGCEDGV